MRLIDAATRELLLANGRDRDDDHRPVLKLFNPAGPATWLICAMEADGDTLFGLCDLGFGDPELGYVSLAEIEEVSAGLAIGLERDTSFRPMHPISTYARAARQAGRIVDVDQPRSGDRAKDCMRWQADDADCQFPAMGKTAGRRPPALPSRRRH